MDFIGRTKGLEAGERNVTPLCYSNWWPCEDSI
jgi:hypothetical protein